MVTAARLYHESVFHRRGRLSGLGLDWVNQPSTFKSYEALPHFPLSRDMQLPQATLWQVLDSPARTVPLRLDALGAALFHAGGLTRASHHRGRELIYRACPSAGALYPCELYAAWPGSPELAPGLYHYDVARHGLTLLREGFPDPAGLGLPERSRMRGEALVFISAFFFRSAWKYRERAYRYLNLDAGHVCEGLVLGLQALGARCMAETDFGDASVDRFLGVDPEREGCLCVVRVACGAEEGESPPPPGPAPGWLERMSRCASVDQNPAALAAIHAACAQPQRSQAAMPPASASRLGSGLAWTDAPIPQAAPVAKELFTAMELRRSRRAFAASPQARGAVARALAALAAPLHGPGGHPAEHACTAGVLAGELAGLAPGQYLLDRPRPSLGLRRDGNFLPVMASVCLDQQWMREAAAHVLFLVDFAELEPCLGARGYRAALQNAGRLGHRLYLAAQSLGMGACGVGAFYDEEAADTLGLPPGAGLLYAVALGPARK